MYQERVTKVSLQVVQFYMGELLVGLALCSVDKVRVSKTPVQADNSSTHREPCTVPGRQPGP